MGVDRGGLNYGIKVQDQFSATFQKFRQEIQAARNALDQFRAARTNFDQLTQSTKESTQAQREQAQAAREAARAAKEQAQAEKQAQRELAAALKDRARIEKSFGDVVRQARKDRAAQAAAETKATLDAARARATEAKTAAQAAAAQEARFKRVRQSLLGAADGGNRLVFTLRNIIGVGAGLAAIQRIQTGFGELLKGGIDFNRQLESSAIGLGSILSSVTNIKNEQGQTLTGAAGFNAAVAISVEQMAKLKQAALATTATIAQLVDTFQVALAPGVRAGLNIDQIRQLAVSVSRAAQAIGVPQNQLSEEIRALLTGTIQARTTRIATALGITPDDIRRAKTEVGGLAKFLDERFITFNDAADRAANTFEGTMARARAAINFVSGEAVKPLFEEIRGGLRDVIALFTQRNNVTGLIEPNPRAVEVLQRVFNGIRDAIAFVREEAKKISFGDVADSATLLGDTFRGIGELLVGVVRGIITAFGAVSRVFTSIQQSLSFLNGNTLSAIGAAMGEILTVTLAWSVAAGVVGFLIRQIAAPIIAIGKGLDLLNLAFYKMSIPVEITRASLARSVITIGLVGAAAAGVFSIFQDWASEQLGVNLTIHDTLEVIDQIAQRAAISGFVKAGEVKLAGIRAQIQGVQSDIQDLQTAQKEGVGNLSSFLGLDSVEKVEQRLISKQKELNNLKLLEKETANNVRQIRDDADKQEGDRIQALRDRIEKAKSGLITPPSSGDLSGFLGFFDKIQQTLAGSLTKPFTDLPKEAEKPLSDVEKRIKLLLEAKNGEDTPFVKAFKTMSDVAQRELDILTQSVQQFSQFVADSIVDAFDPTKDTTIQERFAQFLQSIAKMIISTLVQIAVAKLILGLGTSAAGGVSTTSIPVGSGARSGGLVPHFDVGGPVASPAHYGVVSTPPPGLPATDTVPAWLSPGEFVQRAEAVATYGADMMDALNRRLVDPSSLRAFVGLRSRRNVMPARSLAHAAGGLIGQQVAGAVPAASSQSGPTMAVIAGNDKAVERLLAGGGGAYMRFFRENAEALEGILSQHRRG